MPDAKTLSIMPWVTDEAQKNAIILGDAQEAFGGVEPSVTCPRGYVAKRAIKAAKDMGYTGVFAPELEKLRAILLVFLVWLKNSAAGFL